MSSSSDQRGSPRKGRHHDRKPAKAPSSPSNGSTIATSNQKKHHPNHHHHAKRTPLRTTPPMGDAPADMTVIVNRVKLWDDDSTRQTHRKDQTSHGHSQGDVQAVAPYHFAPDVSAWVSSEVQTELVGNTVAVAHAPRVENIVVAHDCAPGFDLMDRSIPNPHPPDLVHDKYWAQRRRLFSRFDMGVQLDSEGWFSVTPEMIADHVAKRVGDLAKSSAFRRGLPGSDQAENEGIVVLDAFCGCGGNAIAFGKVPQDQISLVVCVDVDRAKLRNAAYNASLYEIPTNKLIFVECNTMFIVGQCYKDGELQIDKLRMGNLPNMPPSAPTEMYAGYRLGGINLLPRRIDAIFMDPPWGGVDYYRLKDGYNLEKHMRIKVGPGQAPQQADLSTDSAAKAGVADDFFDTFGTQPSRAKNNPGILFNATPTDGEYVNGIELVTMAASATRRRLVIYDLPRNIIMKSLGEAALAAGYRGNMKLEEHYMNGRLKTITAYIGADYSNLLH